MRKIIYIFLISIVLFSCDKTEIENAFDKSPEQRVDANLSALNKKLIDNKQGWLTTYVYDNGNTESIITLKFLENNRVEMSFPLDSKVAISSYRLDYTQQIDLVFDTHCELAQLVEDEKAADFRWQLETDEENKISFVSRNEKTVGITYLNLEKFTDDRLAVMTKIQTVKARLKSDINISYFRTLDLESGERFDYSFNANKVVFTSLDKEGVEQVFETEITFTDAGFTLNTPFEVGDQSISEFVYNEEKNQFTTTGGLIKYSNSPAVIPQAIAGYDNGTQYLFLPSFCLEGSSPKFAAIYSKVTADLAALGISFPKMYLTKGKYLEVKLNDKYHGFFFDQKLKDNKVYYTYKGTSITDEAIITAFMPLLQVLFAPKGHFLKFSGKVLGSYNTFTHICADYPNMGIYWIELP